MLVRSFEDDRGSLLGRTGARQRLSMDRAVNAPALRSASIDEDSQADPETVRRCSLALPASDIAL